MWSRAGRDRAQLVAYAAGGGLELNLFPQAVDLHRRRTGPGRRRRAMERYAPLHPGMPMFVHLSDGYGGSTWLLAAIDYGLLVHGRVSSERFEHDR